MAAKRRNLESEDDAVDDEHFESHVEDDDLFDELVGKHEREGYRDLPDEPPEGWPG